MIMIQMSDSKKMKLADYTEKVLRYAGKLMQCVEELDSDGEIGERTYPRMGMRDEDPEIMGGSRDWYGDRRDSRGRYSRY